MKLVIRINNQISFSCLTVNTNADFYQVVVNLSVYSTISKRGHSTINGLESWKEVELGADFQAPVGKKIKTYLP